MGAEPTAASSAATGQGDVCPYAYYKELPFVGKSYPSFSPTDWDSKQWMSYLKSRIVAGSAGSLAAVAVLLLTFVLFVGWRLTSCYKQRNRTISSHKKSKHQGCVRGPVWKVTVTLIGLAGIALALTGMGIVNRSLVHEGWQVIADLGEKTEEVTGAARFLVQESSRLNPIMHQLNQLMSSNVDFDDLTKQTTCVGNFLANLGDPQQLRDAIAFMSKHFKDVKPILDGLDSGLGSLVTDNLPKKYPVMRDVQEARASLYTWSDTLQEYQKRLLAMPKQEPQGKYNSTVVQKLVALHPKLSLHTWTADVSHIQDRFFQFEDIRKSGVWQSLLWQLFSYGNYVPSISEWAIKPVSMLLDYINSQYLQGGGGDCLTRLVQQVKKIDANVAQLGNDTKAAFQQVELLDSMLRQVYNGLITPVTYKESLDNLAATMKATPNTSTITFALMLGNQSVSEFPDVATTLQQYNQARDALAAVMDPMKQVDTALMFYANLTWNYDSVAQAVNLAVGAVTNAVRVLQGAAGDQDVARSSMFARLLREQGEDLQAHSAPFQASMDAVEAAFNQVPPADAFLPLLQSMVTYFKVLPADRRQVVEPVLQYIQVLRDNTVYQPNASWRRVNRTVSGFGNATDMLENQTTHRLEKLAGKWKGPTSEKYAIGYKAVWGLYLLLACSLGFLLVSVWMELQWGWPTASLLVLAAAALLLLLGVAWSALLIVLNDTCADMPKVIASPSMDPKVQNLLVFYMNSQNSTSDVSTALQEAGILDVNMLYSTLNNATYNLTQGVANTNFTLRPTLRNIAKSSVGLTADLSDGIESLLRVADWQSLHSLYLSARSWLCCNVASVAYYQWCFILATGLLGWATVMLVSAIIAHNDRQLRQPADSLSDLELGQKRGFTAEDQFKSKAADTPRDDADETPPVSPFILRPLTYTKPFAARTSPVTSSSSSSQQIATYENDTFEDDANSVDIHTQQSNIPQFSWPGPGNSASLDKSYLTQNGSGDGGFMGTAWLWRGHSQDDTTDSSTSGGRGSRLMEALNTGGSGSSGSSSDARGGRVDALHTSSSTASIRTSLSTIFDTMDAVGAAHAAPARGPMPAGAPPATQLTTTPSRGMPPRPTTSPSMLSTSPAMARAATAGMLVTPPRSMSNSSTPLGSPCSFDSGTTSVPATPAGHTSAPTTAVDVQPATLTIQSPAPSASHSADTAAMPVSPLANSTEVATMYAPATKCSPCQSMHSVGGTDPAATPSMDSTGVVFSSGVNAIAVTSHPRVATPSTSKSSMVYTPGTRFTPFSSATSTPAAAITQTPTPNVRPVLANPIGAPVGASPTPTAAGAFSDSIDPATPQRPIHWVAATPAHTSSPCSFCSHDSPDSDAASSPTLPPSVTAMAITTEPTVRAAHTPAFTTSTVNSPVLDLLSTQWSESTRVGGAESPTRSTRSRTYRRLYADAEEPQVGAGADVELVATVAARPAAGNDLTGSCSDADEDKLKVDASWLSESSELSMQLPMPPLRGGK